MTDQREERQLDYTLWITWYSGRQGEAWRHGYGQCRETVEAMRERFSELTIRKGIFHSALWGPRQHWWLKDPSGQIIDPTAKQHPDGQIYPADGSAYEDLTELTAEEAMRAGHIPCGRCMNCGEPVMAKDGQLPKSSSFCSDACLDAMSKDCGF